MGEMIELILCEKTVNAIKEVSAILGLGFDETVDRLILDYKNLRDGIGASVLTLPINSDAAEGIRKKMKEDGVDASAVMNAAMSKVFKEEEKNFLAFEFHAAQEMINNGARAYDSGKRMDERIAVNTEYNIFHVSISRESIMYLARMAECGFPERKVINLAAGTVGRMISGFNDRWTEKIQFSITAENVEYLRRKIRFGEVPWNIADRVLEFAGVVERHE